ncbi:hypothetical protein SAMN06265182_1479 [Persephonella hydrogeniphila]|uniref:Uncharacterized protein n=1 Tax=Persephonella hydrogeniphila TaxID=198703 RepID=A0A285NJH1_9AQUI|nr:hypothetical protein SAMN06265182_1479 [Persephonella hydrogeniphila]
MSNGALNILFLGGGIAHFSIALLSYFELPKKKSVNHLNLQKFPTDIKQY